MRNTRHTSSRISVHSIISIADDHQVLTSRRSWRSFPVNALTICENCWRQIDDAHICNWKLKRTSRSKLNIWTYYTDECVKHRNWIFIHCLQKRNLLLTCLRLSCIVKIGQSCQDSLTSEINYMGETSTWGNYIIWHFAVQRSWYLILLSAWSKRIPCLWSSSSSFDMNVSLLIALSRVTQPSCEHDK